MSIFARASNRVKGIYPDPQMGCERDLPESEVAEQIDKLTWGTYGLNPTRASKVVTKRLIDLDTDHLENIICNMPLLDQMTKRVIIAILKQRYLAGLSLLDKYLKQNE